MLLVQVVVAMAADPIVFVQPGPQKRVRVVRDDDVSCLYVSSDVTQTFDFHAQYEPLQHGATAPDAIPDVEACAWRGSLRVDASAPVELPIGPPVGCALKGRSSALLRVVVEVPGQLEFTASKEMPLWWDEEGDFGWGLDPEYEAPRDPSMWEEAEPFQGETEEHVLWRAVKAAADDETRATAEQALREYYARERAKGEPSTTDEADATP